MLPHNLLPIARPLEDTIQYDEIKNFEKASQISTEI